MQLFSKSDADIKEAVILSTKMIDITPLNQGYGAVGGIVGGENERDALEKRNFVGNEKIALGEY